MAKTRLSVKEAADLMGASEQFVRRGILSGKFGFAYGVKEEGKKRATYWISAKKFTEETGIKIPEEEEDHEQARNCI